MTDYYKYSIPELVKLFGVRFKEYRLRSNMIQKDVAEESGTTINPIHKFEIGITDNMSLGTFLSLMNAFGQIDALDDIIPAISESAYLIRENQKRVQRIRYCNDRCRRLWF